jgi:hypothetical protein
MGRAVCLNNLGELHRRLGDLPAAEADYQASYETLRHAGHHASPIPLLNIGQIRVAQGHFAVASETIGEALALAVALHRRVTELQARAFLLPCRAAQEAWVDWDSDLKRALSLSEDTGLRDAEIGTAATLAAEMAEARGEPARARAARALAQLHETPEG